jgi:hypothetical protein
VRARTRFLVLRVLAAVSAAALTRVSNAGDWTRAELYGSAAVLIVVLGAVGLPWIETARDGEWRRPQNR